MHPRDDARIFRKECYTEAPYYEVHYVTCDGRGDELTKEGIRIHGIKKYKSKLLRALFAPFEVYKQARVIDADIYVLHDPELLSIALLLKKSGKCVIWDCHEYYDRDIACSSSSCCFYPIKTAFKLWFKAALHIVVPHLDGLIAVTKSVEISLKSRAKKTYVLQNYASLHTFNAFRKFDNEYQHFVLYAGSVASPILHLLHGLELCRNPNIKLILCLRVTTEDRLTRFLGKRNFERVDFYRNVSIGKVASLSQKCFAGIVLPLPYNMGGGIMWSHHKVYEYMAMRLPLICPGYNNNAFIKNLVNNDGHPLGLVVDSNPQVIADTIDYLYEHKEVARTMGMNGRKAFETKYNFESEADGFLKFLEEVSQSKNQNK